MSAFAQDPQVELPWMPERDTNHIRTIKAYLIDTITGTRNLNYTIHYDQHGFITNSLNSLIYDSQGRLIEYIEPIEYMDSIKILPSYNRYKITYTPDGVVQRIEIKFFDSSYSIYELLTHETHPKYGLINYTFLCTNKYGETDKVVDTAFFRREYDTKGHLIHEEWNTTNYYFGNFSNITYRYDDSGRRIAQRGYYHECSDTLNYIYDAQGVLTGMEGILYDLDLEADVIIRCRPDGTRIEAWEYWYSYEEDPNDSEKIKRSDDNDIYHMRYDDRGVLIYMKYPMGITEFEIEYWE